MGLRCRLGNHIVKDGLLCGIKILWRKDEGINKLGNKLAGELGEN